MSLDKAIESGKEHRKPYYGCGSEDLTCRAHGSCWWCRLNRQHNTKKRKQAAEQQMKEDTCKSS